MKIKLNSSVFHDPMPYNTITVDKDKIKFHSFDGAGMGILRAAKMSKEADEPASFTLSAKDFGFISKLGDFTLEFTNNVIKVSNTRLKAKFANVIDYPVYTPTLNDMVDIQVKLDDLLPGTQFIGSDSTYPQLSGVNIFSDKIVASDRTMFYTHTTDTGLDNPINVPGEAFKHILDTETMRLQTNGKMLVSKTAGRSFYTVLIEQKLPDVKMDDEPLLKAKLPRDEMIQALKLIKEYSKYVTISTNSKGIKLYAGEQSNELAIQVNAEIEGEAADLSYDVARLIKITSLMKEDDVSVIFGARMLICDEGMRNNRYVLARYMMPVKKSETKEEK